MSINEEKPVDVKCHKKYSRCLIIGFGSRPENSENFFISWCLVNVLLETECLMKESIIFYCHMFSLFPVLSSTIRTLEGLHVVYVMTDLLHQIHKEDAVHLDLK